MPKLVVVNRAGEEKEVDARVGWSVMEIIRENNFDELLALCGGCRSCATCHVFVDPAFFDRLVPIGAEENDMLDMSPNRAPTSRLSCQIEFGEALDGLKVKIAPEE